MTTPRVILGSYEMSTNSSSLVPSESSDSTARLQTRKYVSSACQACKRGRAKCDDCDPCSRCAARKLQCVREECIDKRRKEIRKRNVQDIQDDSDLLHGWINTIRDSKDARVMQIVSVIRSNATTDEVKAYIKQDILEAKRNKRQPTPELENLKTQIDEVQSHPPRQRRKMDISRMIDEPPYRVPAAPWTNVIDDDILVSNLVSVWLIWDKSIYNWIEEDLFLRDMRQGRLGSTFCSPFLVNALLANACPFSDYEEARTKGGRIAPLMSKFLLEAERLLRETGDEPSITKAQGLGFLYLVELKIGKIAVSYDYLCGAISMCKDLEDRNIGPVQGSNEYQDRTLILRTLQKTYWGLFNILVTTCIFLRKPSVPLQRPQHPMFEPTENFVQSTLYPRPSAPVPFHFEELRYHFCSLSLIVQDVLPPLFQETDKDCSRQHNKLEISVTKLYERLLRWRISLPPHLRFKEDSPPSVLTHEGHFFLIVMTIFNSLKQEGEHIPAKAMTNANRISKEAALKVVDICRVGYSLYGSSLMNMYFTGFISVALDTLSGQPDMYLYSTEITDLCVYLRAASRRFPFSMVTLRAFQLCVQQSGKTLPPATEKLFHQFEKEEWTKSELQQKMSSVPVVGDQKAEVCENVRDLRDFFDMMGNLKIDDNSSADYNPPRLNDDKSTQASSNAKAASH